MMRDTYSKLILTLDFMDYQVIRLIFGIDETFSFVSFNWMFTFITHVLCRFLWGGFKFCFFFCCVFLWGFLFSAWGLVFWCGLFLCFFFFFLNTKMWTDLTIDTYCIENIFYGPIKYRNGFILLKKGWIFICTNYFGRATSLFVFFRFCIVKKNAYTITKCLFGFWTYTDQRGKGVSPLK